ncbi:MAG TPA: Uma2 family endonuclease [Candidatus Kapabacteria bacterium]|jgi:Uma2 family endonuclease|nr:Uma2 family endonuclease [Candidatus Kapabacteria bacterium]
MLETLTQPKTSADYMRLPEGTPIQLIDGEFIMSPAALTIHQRISMRLSARLYGFVSSQGLGEVFSAPTDVHVSYKDVYQPDIFFIASDHLSDIEEDGVYGAPDLVIEILSPSTAVYDRGPKKDGYEKFGVKEYWIVDPQKKSVECFVNSEHGFQPAFSGVSGDASSSVLSGFSLDVQSIF